MMNYIYPLVCSNFDEDKILKVVKNTNCSVMENTETNEWFLVLCGGGMDLSQDIALSYVLLDERIPYDLLMEISKQKDLSVSGKDWELLRSEVIKQLGYLENNAKRSLKEWEGTDK